MTEPTSEQSRELYPFVGTPYERPLFERNGLGIDLDFIPGTLDEVRKNALMAYEAEGQAREAQERAKKYREVDETYETVRMYVDLLESTGWPGGMKLKILPDDIKPLESKQSDAIDGILWPLVESRLNNNEAPELAIGSDGRLYVMWFDNLNKEKKTYAQCRYAPIDLYAKNYWYRINSVQAGLDKLEVPVESNIELPPEGTLDRNGTKLPVGIDLDQIRAKAMTVYEDAQKAEKWAEVKPTVEQIDAIYQDTQLLAKLWRESGMLGATICKILPDEIKPGNFKPDQLVDAVMLPLSHSKETYIKDAPDYMLGPEGRIYNIWANSRDETARTAAYYYYVPLDLYCTKDIWRVERVTEGLDNASKAKH